MFDQFTDRARKIVVLARREARKTGGGRLGTEHLLVGMLLEGSGVAASILEELDLDVEKVRARIAKFSRRVPGKPAFGEPVYTDNAAAAVKAALGEAYDLGHNYVGTEHLLLAVLGMPGCTAAKVLVDLGLDLEAVRKEVKEWITPPDDSAKSGDGSSGPKLVITVNAAPPAKDGGKSIRAADHPQAPLVAALRAAMTGAMSGRAGFEGVPVRMSVHFCRAASRADALNIINGIADVIQRRCHRREHAFDVWVIDDDANVREFHYTEEPAGKDSYIVTLQAVG